MTPDRIINKDPNHVKIFDTTLRDGFQAPGVNVGPEDRFRVATVLAELNVDIIEAGFPISNQENFESVRTIASGIDGPVICALARAKGEDIDRAWEAIEPAKERGGARIHIFIATSPSHMQVDGNTQKQVIAKTREAVRRAHAYTPDVEFSLEDATRTDHGFMKRVVLEAVDTGATTINIPDTVGWAVPEEYAKRITAVRRWIDRLVGKDLVVVSTHCHNDLFGGVDNTLAGVMAGARQVEVSINSIGERAGNAAFEGVVTRLLIRSNYYQVNGKPLSTQIDLSHMDRASKLVAEVSSMFVERNHPVVGSNAFEDESGIHAAKVLKDTKTYHVITPAMLGSRAIRIVVGAESGHSGIVDRATQLGFEIKDHVGLTEKVKEYANSIRREVTDVELERVVADFQSEELKDRFNLKHVETSGRDNYSNATINISVDETSCEVSGTGKGQIEAAISAIKQATGLDADITNFTGKSLSGGADAKAGVTLTVKNEIEITAYAEDASVPLAAIKAYIAALNTIYRTKQRKNQIISS